MANSAESFGKNVKAALGDRSQAWLADESGTTAAMISDYIKGKTFPNLKTAERIADALELPLVDLLKAAAPKATRKSLADLRLEAIGLICTADLADVTGVLLSLKGSPRS